MHSTLLQDPHSGSCAGGTNEKLALIVEDDQATREVVAWVLDQLGYETDAAENGIAGLEALKHRTPDVILLDMRMPVMGGERFIAEYRSLPAPHAPIVLMTARRILESEVEELGAACHIVKPFDLNDLEEAIVKCLGQE